MSEWSGLFKNAIASLDQRLDQAMGVPGAAGGQQAQEPPDPTPIATVADFDLPDAQLEFLELYRARFESMASKIRHLAAENVALLDKGAVSGAAATAKKIDLLMDEGCRLSAQELKLNTTVKRQRAQLAALQRTVEELSAAGGEHEVAERRHGAQVGALEAEITTLRARVHQLEAEVAEHSARIEHYKSLASVPSVPPSDGAELREAVEAHENARQNWLTMETQLLQTIAELEGVAESREQQRAGLKQRLEAAQAQSGELRGLLEGANRQIEVLEASIAQKDGELRELGRALEGGEVSPDAEVPPEVGIPLAEAPPAETPLAGTPLADTLAETPLMDTPPKPSPPSPPSPHPYENIEPPPLTEFVDDFDPGLDTPLETGSLDTPLSPGAPSLPLITKLSQANRKLESQLVILKQSVAKARSEKDAAYAELLQHMDAREQLAAQRAELEQLRPQHDRLLVKLGQKSEQVDELRADVADLKEMYQQQIQALIDKLESKKC